MAWMTLGLGFQASLEGSADVRGVAIGPGAFDQDATRMGVAGVGASNLADAALHACIPRVSSLRYASALSGRSKRVRSPSAATRVTAPVHCTPRQGLKRLDAQGASATIAPGAWSACARRCRRSVCSLTARTYS